MANPLNFVESLDALVRLCAARPEEYAEQQLLLRVAARAVAAGEVTLVTGPTWPTLNGVDMDGAAAAPDGLVARLWGRGFQRLFVARDTEPADLLLLARALAGAPTGEPDGAELRLRTIRLVPAAADDADLRPDLPIATFLAPELPGRNPFEPTPREPTPTSGMSAVPLEIVVGHGDAGLPEEQRRVAPMINTPILLRTIVAQDKRDLPLAELLQLLPGLGALPEWQRVPELSLILEELGRRAEGALRDGDALLLRDIMLPVLRNGDAESQDEARLTYRQLRRRLLTPSYLRLLAPMLPRIPDSREDLVYLLGQAGDEGADVVIELLVAAESSSDRRVYTSTLVRLKAGERTLLHMLADERWYVVRNAADLLGEMRAAGVEEPLLGVLRHDDERVRYSALGALGRLGTPRALHAVQDALQSPLADVRARAASVLAASSWPYTVAAVRRRLRDEEDPDVQLALVAALGRVASNDAVAVLAELAEPQRLSLLRRRHTPLRSAALQSLVDAHTPAARAIVERLSRDGSGELRAAARRAIDHWSAE